MSNFPFGGSTPQSVHTANRISHSLLAKMILPAITDRLTTIGDVMTSIAGMYAEADGATADEVAQSYRTTIGDWSAEEAG